MPGLRNIMIDRQTRFIYIQVSAYLQVVMHGYLFKEIVSMNDFKETAEMLRVVAHPVRLEILQKLETNIFCVSDMEDFLGISQSNVSQHLAVLRRYGLVNYYIDGKQRCYFLKDPRTLDVLTLVKKKYEGELQSPACCPVKKI
jgi:DNA-binding transcriptional ArsR family regulator